MRSVLGRDRQHHAFRLGAGKRIAVDLAQLQTLEQSPFASDVPLVDPGRALDDQQPLERSPSVGRASQVSRLDKGATARTTSPSKLCADSSTSGRRVMWPPGWGVLAP